ncbi:amidohydrolase/deacetylase family metallohydrolase [Streptomyces sp. NPDC048172]|uniref:amidohydrolase/deacetylase family metallohydrolase n=1 Tax=Streptomyces sp. NPDC048172 TaxID=3365505 RepID=UPI00371600B8
MRVRAHWAAVPAVLSLVLGASVAADAVRAPAQQARTPGAGGPYDLLIRGGHVIDPRGHVDGRRDLAVRDGKIAKVARSLAGARAKKTVDASGKYVTPGLIDLHAHLYNGHGDAYADGALSVPPDGFTFRSGVTTAVDAGSPGWRNFDAYKKDVIDRSETRVLAFLNIVGHGMAGGEKEQDLGDMKAEEAARVARAHPGVVIGIKTAHYEGKDWTPVERSVEAGEAADVPVMVDFGEDHPERPLDQLLTEKLRPGDLYTHAYSGLRGELGEDGRLNPGMREGRERGVLFDVGHGGGSFDWDVAVPAMKEGFEPDTISTDLHTGSMNAGMKDMPTVMSKFLTLGMPLKEVVEASTWKPAQAIGRKDLGHLSVGAPADVALFSLERGRFGYTDSFGERVDGERKLAPELTVRAGEVVWDLNGRAAKEWRP